MEMVAQNHERHAKFVYFIFRANEHATSFCNNKHRIVHCSGDDRHRDRAYLVENFNDFPSHYFKVNTDFTTDIVSIVLNMTRYLYTKTKFVR